MLTHVEKIVVSFSQTWAAWKEKFFWKLQCFDNNGWNQTLETDKLWKLFFLTETTYLLDSHLIQVGFILFFTSILVLKILYLEHEATKIGRIPFLCKSLQYFVFFCLFIVLKAFSRHGAWIMCKNGGIKQWLFVFSIQSSNSRQFIGPPFLSTSWTLFNNLSFLNRLEYEGCWLLVPNWYL